jgi:hypothetical protein
VDEQSPLPDLIPSGGSLSPGPEMPAPGGNMLQNLGGTIANSIQQGIGYATQNPQLQKQAIDRQALNERMQIMTPLANTRAQIQDAMAKRDYEGAFNLYQQNARLAILDPSFAKLGSDLAGQIAALKQRHDAIQSVETMTGYTPAERTTIAQMLNNGEPIKEALAAVNESRKGWTYSPADAEGNIWRQNAYTGEREKVQDRASIKMTPGETVGHIDEAGWHPSATATSLVKLTPMEEKGAALTPGFDQAEFQRLLNSGDVLERQQAAAQRAQLFRTGQASESKPGTDVETAKIAGSIPGIGVRPYLSDYNAQELSTIVARQQQLKFQLIGGEAAARVSAEDQIQRQKGIKEAYGGRYQHEVVYDTSTGQHVTANEQFGSVMDRLGKDRILLDKESARVVDFARRGQSIIDQLADRAPQLLAAGGGPGGNMANAIRLAVQRNLLPSSAIAEWDALKTMSKYDVVSVESRTGRPLAQMVKDVGATQIGGDTETIGSFLGKARVAKTGLLNVQEAAFGKPLSQVNQVEPGSLGPTGTAPSGRTVPVLQPR